MSATLKAAVLATAIGFAGAAFTQQPAPAP